jgi:DNA polymerase III alpha subunit
MQALLIKLMCSTYLHLVAASSLIRPGTSKSMPDYIERFHDPSKTIYLHPVMEELLKETHGIIVYQEDVIKVCMHYAGMNGNDADVLQRGMSGKWRSPQEMERVRGNFFAGAKKLERPEDTSQNVWDLVAAFAGYSFSKAHSASFAVESYPILYLKTTICVSYGGGS